MEKLSLCLAFGLLFVCAGVVNAGPGQCGYNNSAIVDGPLDFNATSVANLTFVLSGRKFGNVLNPTVAVSFTSNDTPKKTVFGTSEPSSKSEPDWTKAFKFEWKKGTQQKWHFFVIEQLQAKVKTIGEAVLGVDSYVESGQDASIELTGGNHLSGKTITVKKTEPFRFKLSARNLPNREELGNKNDPFVKVYFRSGANGANNKFYTTAVVNNVDDVDWADIQFNVLFL